MPHEILHEPSPRSALEDARALLSLAGALALNLVVAVNHRPGRTLGV
jgi:hypothetical protein